ncbi:hypothetical protein PG985_011358 [Apiospora marii]|uniref:F-box domain-containing protein n=1 Tax=Apiospora marii TaxID=335849 RepID=A0ABR1STG1_9PEZI
MDKLSFELISLIVDNLEKISVQTLEEIDEDNSEELNEVLPLAPYAVISRQWQAVIERRTFAHLNVSDPHTFQTVVASSPSRLAALRVVCFELILPTHGELRVDHRQNQTAFLSAITSLLGSLAAGEGKLHDDHYNKTHSMGSIELRLGTKFRGRRPRASAASKRSIALREEDLETMAKVRGVSHLNVVATDWVEAALPKLWAPSYVPLHPFTSCQLATHFPGLQRLQLQYRDPALKRAALRKTTRSALARGIDSLGQLPKLEELSIQRVGHEPANHSFDNPCLEDNERIDVAVDTLCDSLRKLAQNGRLQKLELQCEFISPDLFRDRRRRHPGRDHDGDQGKEETEDDWPSLRSFEIRASIVAPSGRWYYTGNQDDVEQTVPLLGVPSVSDVPADDGEDDVDDVDNSSEACSDADADDFLRDREANGAIPLHPWRTKPIPEEFNPLVVDLVSAVGRMPRLKSGSFLIDKLEHSGFYGRNPILLRCHEAGELIWNKREERNEVVTSDETQEPCRLWEIEFDKDTAWKVPPKLRRQCVDWVGPGGKVLIGHGYGEDSD